MSDRKITKTRRQFLKDSLLLALGSVLLKREEVFAGISDDDYSKTAQVYDLIIIGAGMSGLAAAAALKAANVKVLVLEARNRIGGRVWTENFSSGIKVDLGASWIHGIKKNPLYDICLKAKIKTLPTNYESAATYSSDGSEFGAFDRLEQISENLIAQQEEARDERESNGAADISLGQDFQNIVNTFGLSSEEIKQINFYINTSIEHEYATDVNNLSALYWDEGRGFSGGDVLFPGGYKQVISQVANKVKAKLGHIVSSIDYQEDIVKVSTNKGEFSAAKVLVTLPIGVLKAGSVTFNPPLPAAKLKAINALGAGLLNKTYLLFSKVFWPQNVHLLNYISEEKGHWAEWINMYKYINKPMLLGFNAGDYAVSLESLSDADTVASAMQVLRRIYGQSIPDPVTTMVTRWKSDPFSMGSYSYLSVGATPSNYDDLASPIDNKIYFAGEATNKSYAATVHGAYLSGLREAARIKKQLN